MMDVLSVILFMAMLTSHSSFASSFSEVFPDWPDHCCKLELEKYEFGHQLPTDLLFGGDVKGKRFGYAVDRHQKYGIEVVSERFADAPIRFDKDGYCRADKRPLFEVLTNPNGCAIDWYTTRYEGEMFINSTGVLRDKGRVYMPAFNGYYFARRNESQHQEDEGKEQIMAGASFQGEAMLCDTADQAQRKHKERGTQILGVDCLASLVSMSSVKLVNITVHDDDIESVRESDAVYFKRSFINKSNVTQKQAVAFSAEKTNSMFVSVSESFSSSKCTSQRSSFSERFGTTVSSEIGFSLGFWIFSMSAKLGISVSTGFEKMSETSSRACTEAGSLNQTSNTHTETKTYSFSDEISIPGHSLTTVTASSTQMRGKIPFIMTYEMTAVNAGLTDQLLDGLKHYKLGDRIESTDRGTLLIHFDGAMIVDTGYEIVVNVNATDIPDTDPDFYSSRQSLLPSK
jgi:hypothetical protein